MRTSPLNCLLDALPRADTPPLVGEPGAVHPCLRGRVGATGDERLQPQQGHAPGTHRPPQGLRQQPPRYTQSGSRTVGRGRWPSAWASLHRKPRGFSWPARQRTVRLGELSTRHACSMVLSLTSGPGRRKRMRVVGGGSSACVVRVRGVSCPSPRGRKVLGSLDYRWARGIVRRRTGHGLLLGSWLVPHRPRPPDRVGRIPGLMRYGRRGAAGCTGPRACRALGRSGPVRTMVSSVTCPDDRQVVADGKPSATAVGAEDLGEQLGIWAWMDTSRAATASSSTSRVDKVLGQSRAATWCHVPAPVRVRVRVGWGAWACLEGSGCSAQMVLPCGVCGFPTVGRPGQQGRVRVPLRRC